MATALAAAMFVALVLAVGAGVTGVAAARSVLHTAAVTLVLFGAVAFSMGPIVQNRIIEAAGAGGSLVSAANQGAFNIANAIGAAGGAYVIRIGFGLTGTMWVGAVLAAAGAVLVLFALSVDRRTEEIAAPDQRELATARS